MLVLIVLLGATYVACSYRAQARLHRDAMARAAEFRRLRRERK